MHPLKQGLDVGFGALKFGSIFFSNFFSKKVVGLKKGCTFAAAKTGIVFEVLVFEIPAKFFLNFY
ncbi:hypothetical protein ULVI_01815 [Cochleicola gelatinilyticus]|uniref:Uncharacterized protein n=1 Tax=Cochleicola gelatinilyticus TaxID=1763537 RepID=A0A167JVC7_9FLAO|nr:hypothetical protein ULVI_01815 [Cochleicola gelatinilyticus]